MFWLNKRIKLTILFICGTLGIILLGLFLINRLYYRSDPPPFVGEINLAGLQDTTIISLAGGKTYQIAAHSNEDMYFAAGYLAARDDLFHLTIMSAAGRGELTHVFGETAALADQYARYLKLPVIAEKAIVYLNRELKNVIDRYCAGINVGIKEYHSSFPVDFRTRGIVPKPWETRDVVGAFLLVNSNRSENVFLELLAESINSYYGQEKLGQMINEFENGTFTISDRQLAEPEELLLMQRVFFELTGLSMANTTTINWAISGKNTQSGRPLLVAARNSGISHYGTWKTMTLNNKTTEISGVFLAGFPFPFTGTNGSIAWSIFPTESLRESLPSQMSRTDSESSGLKGWQSTQEEESFALACASTLNGLWDAVNAENLSALLTAIGNVRVLDSRYVVTDAENNIGLLDNTTNIINPENGNIIGEIRAVDKIMAQSKDMFQNSFSGQTTRIQTKLDAHQILTPKILEALIWDPVSPYAQTVTEHLMKSLLPWDELTLKQRKIVKLLDDWSGDESSESQAALIFEMTLLKLAENIFRDEMDLISKDLYRIFLGLPIVVHKAVYAALMSQAFSWYDDVRTIGYKELKEEVVQTAFADAIAEIEQRVGRNPQTWSWGAVHRSSGMQTIDSRGKRRKGFWGGDKTIPLDGSWTTIVRSPYNLAEPFTSIEQAAYQCMLDLGEPEEPMRIIAVTRPGRNDDDSNNINTQEKLAGPQSTTIKNELILVPAG